MLYAQTPPPERRRLLRERLAGGEMMNLPGPLIPLLGPAHPARSISKASTSPAPCSVADLGLPDIGLTTLSEVAGRGRQIARMTDLPTSSTPTPVWRAHERRPHRAGIRGRRLAPPHRGPGQSQALRPPRRQGLSGRADTAIKRIRAARCPPRRELRHHGAHRHPRAWRLRSRRSTAPRSSWMPAPTRFSRRRWPTLDEFEAIREGVDVPSWPT